MAENKISVRLSDEDRAAIKAAVEVLIEKLPFLLTLEADARKRLTRLGDKSLAFVTKALEVAKQNPDFLPRGFDIEEFDKDVTLVNDLLPLRLSLLKLDERLDDTIHVVGNEAYVMALLLYNILRVSNIGTEGLDSTIDDMGKRFARKAKAIKLDEPKSSK